MNLIAPEYVKTMFFHCLYICSAADFISHSIEALKTEDIDAITCLVGETATKFMQQDPPQPLQLYCGGFILDTASNRTTTKMKSRRVPPATSASLDALGQK